MNIKKGDVLKWKTDGEEHTVLAVIDGLYAIAESDDVEEIFGWYTLKGLKETFELPEEKWVPKMDELYFSVYLGSKGAEVDSYGWNNDSADKIFLNSSNVFPTKEAAEAKLSEILNLLKK